jgi:hypothetical protein
MTIVGKILCFLVLVLSLVQGALVIFINNTSVRYAAALSQEKKDRQVVEANAQAWQSRVKEVETEKQTMLDQMKATLTRVESDLNAQQAFNLDLKRQLSDEQQKTVRADARAKAADIEVARREEDVVSLRTTVAKEIKKGTDLLAQNIRFKEEKTAAEILAQATLKRNREMESELQDQARTIAKMRANAGVSTKVVQGGLNPPNENIEGLVKVADRDGLVKITLGTDAGLVRGHTMQVFRLNPNNPSLSKYLGVISIIDVNATEAIGKPMGKMAAPLQPGDSVASRILGT